MNDTILVGNIICKICPQCDSPILEDEITVTDVTDITKRNIEGDRTEYHRGCYDERMHDIIEDMNQRWGEEPVVEE